MAHPGSLWKPWALIPNCNIPRFAQVRDMPLPQNQTTLKPFCNIPSYPSQVMPLETIMILYTYISNENSNKNKHSTTLYINVEIRVMLHMKHIHEILITL
jgi:hypothetical protein